MACQNLGTSSSLVPLTTNEEYSRIHLHYEEGGGTGYMSLVDRIYCGYFHEKGAKGRDQLTRGKYCTCQDDILIIMLLELSIFFSCEVFVSNSLSSYVNVDA